MESFIIRVYLLGQKPFERSSLVGTTPTLWQVIFGIERLKSASPRITASQASATTLKIPTHRWRDLSIDFATGLPILTDWKGKSYDSIFLIVDRLTNRVPYEPVKVTINAAGLARVILDLVLRYHGLPDSIISDRGSIFTSKCWPFAVLPPLH